MKRTNKKVSGKQKYRFYKSGLPKVVWSKNENKPLAVFEGGTFTTDNINVARILLDKGYYQISPDAKEPPNVLVTIPGRSLGKNENIKVGAMSGPANAVPRIPVVQEGPSYS